MTSQPEPATTLDAACGAGSEEAALIRAAKRGDRVAFERLVRAYDRSVLRLAYNWLRSAEDAREVYQETFLRVYKNLGQFREDCNFQTWLYRIAVNTCLDYLRKRKVRREEPCTLETEEGAQDRISGHAEPHPQADPQRLLASRELRERIEQALEELSPRERAVFELRHYHGLRLRMIGQILGTSEEAAKTSLFRAHEKMRARLKDWL